ncbi:MAG TPA: hypothetical protein VK897_11275 [Anaerolineales bacterium]|nr:hypothetical protein [Anaerolineales bacterium]
MSNKKVLASILLVLAVLLAQVGNVAAAPQAQETTLITGTIESITTETDANEVTTVLVTLTVEGETQTVRLSLETAGELYLINPETLQIDETLVGETVVIDSTTVIADEEPAEEDVHPIAWLLAEFFHEEPSIVNDYHEDGFGFGVIAQALWISRNITGTEEAEGDASLAADILQAKQDKDFQTFFEEHQEYFEDFEGDVPTNWGQFKKALAEKKNNLGVVVSGQADEDGTEDPAAAQDHGNDKDKKDKKEKKDKKDKKP